jgi:hypothetical protein
MTTSTDFHFALLRISAAQLLRTVGIDRCAPSVLDTVTDIILRHLHLLAITSQKLATLSGRQEVAIEDLAEAMVQIGVVKPAQYLDTSNYETDLLLALGDNEGVEHDDYDDENDNNNDKMDYDGPADHHANYNNMSDADRARAEQGAFRKHKITGLDVDGFHNFIDWAKGPVTQDARFISRVVIPPQGPSLNAVNVNNPLLSTAPTSASTAAASSSTNAAAATTSTAGTAADTKPDSEGSAVPAPSQPLQLQPPDLPIKTEAWLHHLMKKQVKVGYEKRFQTTILASASSSATNRSGYYHNDTTINNDDDDVINEYKISGGPATLDEAVHTFSQRQVASASPLPATLS